MISEQPHSFEEFVTDGLPEPRMLWLEQLAAQSHLPPQAKRRIITRCEDTKLLRQTVGFTLLIIPSLSPALRALCASQSVPGLCMNYTQLLHMFLFEDRWWIYCFSCFYSLPNIEGLKSFYRKRFYFCSLASSSKLCVLPLLRCHV